MTTCDNISLDRVLSFCSSFLATLSSILSWCSSLTLSCSSLVQSYSLKSNHQKFHQMKNSRIGTYEGDANNNRTNGKDNHLTPPLAHQKKKRKIGIYPRSNPHTSSIKQTTLHGKSMPVKKRKFNEGVKNAPKKKRSKTLMKLDALLLLSTLWSPVLTPKPSL